MEQEGEEQPPHLKSCSRNRGDAENFFWWQATPTTVHNSNIITPVASAAIEKLKLTQREPGDRDRDPALRVATDVQEGDLQPHREIVQICVSLGELQQRQKNRREMNISTATHAENTESSGRDTC